MQRGPPFPADNGAINRDRPSCVIDPNGVGYRRSQRGSTLSSLHTEDALELLRAEYLEMSDLALTPSQVASLLALEGETAAIVIQTLEDSGFLERTPEGRFIHRPHRVLEVAFTHD